MPPRRNTGSTVGEMSVEDMKTLIADIMKPLNDTVAKLQQDIAGFQDQVKGLELELTKKDERISELETVISEGLDEREQYSRRNNIRIFGIKESNGEDTDQLVVDLAEAKLNVVLSKDNIDRSHRVGKPGDKPRPIIVKFVSYAQRRAVFTRKKLLKGSGVSVSEDLTKIRRDLLKRAMDVYSKESVWSSDGVILVNINKPKPFRVRNEKDFQKLLAKHPPSGA